MHQKIFRLPIMCLALFTSWSLQAEEAHWYNYDHLYIHGGTYYHYGGNDDPNYAGTHIVLKLDAVKENDWLYGLSLFDNSFGQFSQYIYGGKRWNYHGAWEGFNTKITMGLMHGYKGRFKDKIPLNDLGTAPALLLSIGYKQGGYGVDLTFFGAAGLLFTVGMDT